MTKSAPLSAEQVDARQNLVDSMMTMSTTKATPTTRKPEKVPPTGTPFLDHFATNIFTGCSYPPGTPPHRAEVAKQLYRYMIRCINDMNRPLVSQAPMRQGYRVIKFNHLAHQVKYKVNMNDYFHTLPADLVGAFIEDLLSQDIEGAKSSIDILNLAQEVIPALNDRIKFGDWHFLSREIKAKTASISPEEVTHFIEALPDNFVYQPPGEYLPVVIGNKLDLVIDGESKTYRLLALVHPDYNETHIFEDGDDVMTDGDPAARAKAAFLELAKVSYAFAALEKVVKGFPWKSLGSIKPERISTPTRSQNAKVVRPHMREAHRRRYPLRKDGTRQEGYVDVAAYGVKGATAKYIGR